MASPGEQPTRSLCPAWLELLSGHVTFYLPALWSAGRHVPSYNLRRTFAALGPWSAHVNETALSLDTVCAVAANLRTSLRSGAARLHWIHVAILFGCGRVLVVCVCVCTRTWAGCC